LPYRQLVGGLLWLAVSTHPDIQYAVQQLSQYLDCFTYTHWNAAMRMLQYLKGTRTLGISLGGSNPIQLVGFMDSDWANCLDMRRSVGDSDWANCLDTQCSIGGYAWSLGSGAVSWAARKQKTVAASSCEAEYMAAFESAQECIWLRALLKGIDHDITDKPTPILCDNNAAIKLSEDPTLHSRVKHVDIKYHFLRERAQSNEICIRYINTKYNVADLFTKALPASQFKRLRDLLGLRQSHDSCEEETT
ncbi:Copia protein, partial [Termitomyces sp. J132]